MIPCDAFFSALQERGVAFFAGVPDSLLSAFARTLRTILLLSSTLSPPTGKCCCNCYGSAVSTGSVPVVYMQNSAG